MKDVKDVHDSQSFILTHSEESDSLLFILCLRDQMLLTSSFSKENSAIPLEEGVGLGVYSVHHCHQEVEELY